MRRKVCEWSCNYDKENVPHIIYQIIAYDLKKYCLKPRGQFPGKYCNLFVNCWDGFAVEQFCAQPLLFNPISHYCDYSFNVNCQGRPIIGNKSFYLSK